MVDLISKAAAIDALKRAAYWQDAERKIAELPAVDAVPVVHARWQRLSPFVDTEECSNCRYNIPSEELETPYCPWCGAKMDGERRDDQCLCTVIDVSM